MDIQLNFLRYEPVTNWLDYFLNRQKLLDILTLPTIDRQTLALLCDQFIEQAMASDKDLALLERKQLDKEDIICMRHKVDDLWMCAMSCLASLDWDLQLLMKNSNVIRVWACMNRLVRWAFEEEEDHQLRQILAEDPFKFVCSLPRITPANLFPGWLYARWILLVDLEGRFPSAPARPTVSNPSFYIDQSLIFAEKLSNVAFDVRKRLPDAVLFLNTVLNLETCEVPMPAKECFFPRLDLISKASPLAVLSNFPKPNFGRGTLTINTHIFRSRILFDLIVAHFSARHFKSAKTLLFELIARQTLAEQARTSFERSLLVEQCQLDGYKTALGMDEKGSNRPSQNGEWPPESGSLVTFCRQRPKHQISPSHLVQLLLEGVCRISRTQLSQLGLPTNDELQKRLIEEIIKEITDSTNVRGSEVELLKRARLVGSLYFFCAFCHRFSDSLQKHARAMVDQRHITIRQLVVFAPSALPPPPSAADLQELSAQGPPFWSVVTSFDHQILAGAFAKLNLPRIHEQRMVFSQVTAEPILSRSNAQGDRQFLWNQIMLWKLEQLARIGNTNKWKEFLNHFVKGCKIVLDSNLQNLFIFDTVRMELTNWNLHFCRFNEPVEQERQMNSVSTLLNSALNIAVQTNCTAFQCFGKEVSQFLLNNRNWKLFTERIKSQPLYKSGFTDLATIIAFYLVKLHEERKLEDVVKVRDILWNVTTPIFDEPRTGVESRQGLLSKSQLIEFLQGVKDRDVLNLFLGMVAYLLNYTITTSAPTICDQALGDVPVPVQKMRNSAASLVRSVSQHIFIENLELWQSIKLDEYKNRPLDASTLHQLMGVLCKQTQLVGPVYLSWLRTRADYAFFLEKYGEAAQLYLEVLVGIQRGLVGVPGVEGGGTGFERLLRKLDTDLIYGKLAVALHHLRMPTLAAILGQMRTDIRPHLELVEHLLCNTPLTVDAGPAYFPLIADIHLMEKMAAVYEKLDLHLYTQALLKLMPTRAINVNNLPVILERECVRRRTRFMEILFKQFFGENLGRP